MKIPGYIDLQVNGLKGVSYSASDLTLESFIFTCQELIKENTIAFLPTIITSPVEIIERNISIIKKAAEKREFSKLIAGIHLEGPFISREDGFRGAHNPEWIIEPNISLLKRLQKSANGLIKLITVSAELPKITTFIRSAKKLGITVALGHQNSTPIQLKKAFDAGATLFTHLGNGIPHTINRFNNPIWYALANDNFSISFIPDGHHLPPDVIKVFFRCKGADKMIAVSDASPIALMLPGEYQSLGNKAILDKNGKLYNPDTGYLVGSASTLKQCVEFLKTLDFLTERDIVKMVYYNPLKLLKNAM